MRISFQHFQIRRLRVFLLIAVESVVLVAPQGFEPRLIGSEPTVLPLNEGAAAGKALSRSRERVRSLAAS